jgi:adenine-specific DNA-methyltransferase
VAYANDWQDSAFVTASASVALNAAPKKGVAWIRELNDLKGRQGPFFENYCAAGNAQRNYFSKENGMKIQAIRERIADWRRTKQISALQERWLIACLIEAADEVANTASVYGAYLKILKKSAQKKLHLEPLQPVSSARKGHSVFRQDAVKLLKKLDGKDIRLTYIDPPYNHRQYGANYHILETLARWDMDSFAPRGKTGLRAERENRSAYCLKNAEEAFAALLCEVRSEYLLVSYNTEGLLSEGDFRRLIRRHFELRDFRRISHNRFRADKDGEKRSYSADRTEEFLFLGRNLDPRRKEEI